MGYAGTFEQLQVSSLSRLGIDGIGVLPEPVMLLTKALPAFAPHAQDLGVGLAEAVLLQHLPSEGDGADPGEHLRIVTRLRLRLNGIRCIILLLSSEPGSPKSVSRFPRPCAGCLGALIHAYPNPLSRKDSVRHWRSAGQSLRQNIHRLDTQLGGGSLCSRTGMRFVLSEPAADLTRTVLLPLDIEEPEPLLRRTPRWRRASAPLVLRDGHGSIKTMRVRCWSQAHG